MDLETVSVVFEVSPSLDLATLLTDNRVQEVARLYSLLSRVEGGVALLKTGFSSYIKVGQNSYQLKHYHYLTKSIGSDVLLPSICKFTEGF